MATSSLRSGSAPIHTLACTRDGIRVNPRRRLLAEVTPVRGDDEKYTRERKRDTCDDRSGGGKPEFRDLRRGKPDPSKQDEQESDFRKAPTRVMRQSDDVHVWHSCCPAPTVSRRGGAAALFR